MNKKNSIEKTIHLLNKSFTVSCPAEEEARFEQAVYYLNQKLDKIQSNGRVIGSERLALMTALTIAHELIAQRDGQAIPTTETSISPKKLEDQLNRIKNKLEESLSSVIK